jgi:hypothetical protein
MHTNVVEENPSGKFKVKTQAQVEGEGEGVRKELKGHCSPRNNMKCLAMFLMMNRDFRFDYLVDNRIQSFLLFS